MLTEMYDYRYLSVFYEFDNMNEATLGNDFYDTRLKDKSAIMDFKNF